MAFSVRATASAIGLRKHARTFGRIALGLLFVWAGATKLSAPRAFAATISRFDLVPESALPVLAIGLPLIELIAGLGAAAGRRDSLHVILAMLVLFSAVLGYAFLSGIDVDCGCFGPADGEAHEAVRTALMRDILLIPVTVWLLPARRRGKETYVPNKKTSDSEDIP